VDKDDFRIKRMARKAGSLIVFVVDASGSMALNRMDAAKGAAISLLSEAYKCRDKICLVEFHGNKAEILVPPTKSMALTKNRLESMPCGGGSPLAHALTLAMRTGLNAKKVKQDVGRVIIVLLTDGRANIPVGVSMGETFDPIIDPESKDGVPSRKFLKDEVLACAKQLGALEDFSLLCIDTEDQFVGTGIARAISQAARGNYYHILETDSSAVSHITKQGLEAARVMASNPVQP
jgi:magnesium chelatase subunit D